MRELLPLDFAALGWAEFVWLALAGACLSAAAGSRPRVRAAVILGGTALALSLLRAFALLGDPTAWLRWGPVFVWPAGLAALALFGPRLGGERGAAAGGVVLVAFTAIVRPWDLAFAEWLFVFALGGGLAVALRGGFALPLAAWAGFAAAFVGFCAWTAPFGVGPGGACAVLAGIAAVIAVLGQGEQMTAYVLRRLAGAPIVLLLLLVMSFALMRAAPGGPFDKDKRVDPEIQKLLEKRYRLDQPWLVQFGDFVEDLAWRGELGESFKQKGKTVNEIIAHHVKPSAMLGLTATAIALLVGVTAGIVAGVKRNSVFDYASMTGAMLGLALPTFVVGPFLVLLFVIHWNPLDLKVAGWGNFPKDLILPAVTLALPFLSRIARLTRAGMLEVVHQDYIRTARAKGLSERAVVVRHTLKGTLMPVVSFLGPAVAQLLTGSLVVETIFGVPGLGVEFVQSALNRDYSLAMGLVLVFGTLLIVFNLVVDVLYGFLDPRIRHA